MKKTVLIVMSFLLAFALVACSGKNAGNDNSVNNSNVSDRVQATDKNSGEETSSFKNPNETGGKTLVVYYSATGNTKEAAEYIAAATGGDMFELVPAQPYSGSDLNYNDKSSRVVYEHDNPDKRDVALVSATVENFNEYDTVFIGYAGGIIGLN